MRLILPVAMLVACDPAVDEVRELQTEQGRYDLFLTLHPDPPVAGPAVIEVQVLHEGQPVEGALFEVDPFMPAHGHGAGEVEVSEEGGGWYRADFHFTMPGFWEVTFTIDGEPGRDVATVGWDVG